VSLAGCQMPFISQSKAAKLAGVSRGTIANRIDEGVLSRAPEGIDLAELARVFPDISVDRIERPARALFLLTSLTPTALGAWIALLAAMPFASDVAQLSRFAFGVVISSFLWHPVLGALASTLSNRLGKRGHLRMSRFGGLSMGLLGLILGAQQFS